MIFAREFKRNQKALLIWTVVISGLVVWLLSIYPQFAEKQATMEKLLEAYPESMQKAFGMDKLSFGTLIGFYGIEIYMMTTLLGSIYASMLASNIVAKEENEKTIEFLLSKPVTRSEIIAQKLLLVIVNILILNGMTTIATVIGFQFTEHADVPYQTFMILVIACVLLHLTFAAISFMFSTMMKKTRNILSLSLGIVLISYFFNVMAGISEDLDFLKYISLFKYIDAANIINDTFDILYFFIMGAIILLCILVAFMIYKKKDIAG